MVIISGVPIFRIFTVLTTVDVVCEKCKHQAVLQIRRGKRDNLEIISFSSKKKHILRPVIRTTYVFIVK